MAVRKLPSKEFVTSFMMSDDIPLFLCVATDVIPSHQKECLWRKAGADTFAESAIEEKSQQVRLRLSWFQKSGI
jgi:hypothetical protein